MRKLIAILAIFCLVLSFAACSQPQTTENVGTTPNMGNPGDPNAPYCMYNGAKIALNGDMQVIVNALGEPKSYYESASCAFEGMDKTYTYDSIIIDTYPDGEHDYVYRFWFMDDMVQTTEGIKIGDSSDAVAAAYGAETYNGRSSYIIQKDKYTITINLENGVVNHIEYGIVIG